MPIGEHEIGEDTFEESGGVCNIIGRSVLREQERGDLRRAGVVVGRSPEFEKVEEREDGDEERGAP